MAARGGDGAGAQSETDVSDWAGGPAGPTANALRAALRLRERRLDHARRAGQARTAGALRVMSLNAAGRLAGYLEELLRFAFVKHRVTMLAVQDTGGLQEAAVDRVIAGCPGHLQWSRHVAPHGALAFFYVGALARTHEVRTETDDALVLKVHTQWLRLAARDEKSPDILIGNVYRRPHQAGVPPSPAVASLSAPADGASSRSAVSKLLRSRSRRRSAICRTMRWSSTWVSSSSTLCGKAKTELQSARPRDAFRRRIP